jgi:hypothetical protein
LRAPLFLYTMLSILYPPKMEGRRSARFLSEVAAPEVRGPGDGLGGAAGVALGQLADVVQEDGLLRRGEVFGVLGDLGEEGVGG